MARTSNIGLLYYTYGQLVQATASNFGVTNDFHANFDMFGAAKNTFFSMFPQKNYDSFKVYFYGFFKPDQDGTWKFSITTSSRNDLIIGFADEYFLNFAENLNAQYRFRKITDNEPYRVKTLSSGSVYPILIRFVSNENDYNNFLNLTLLAPDGRLFSSNASTFFSPPFPNQYTGMTEFLLSSL